MLCILYTWRIPLHILPKIKALYIFFYLHLQAPLLRCKFQWQMNAYHRDRWECMPLFMQSWKVCFWEDTALSSSLAPMTSHGCVITITVIHIATHVYCKYLDMIQLQLHIHIGKGFRWQTDVADNLNRECHGFQNSWLSVNVAHSISRDLLQVTSGSMRFPLIKPENFNITDPL